MKILRKRDSGASLVEFAILMPFLLLLVLGIVEFGFLLGKMNEVRHATREGARYAAVSNPDQDGDADNDSADVVQVVCDSLGLTGATVEVVLASVSGLSRLDDASITVTVTGVTSLSGAPLISSLIPGTLSSDAVFRLEQDATWTTGTTSNAC